MIVHLRQQTDYNIQFRVFGAGSTAREGDDHAALQADCGSKVA